QSITAKKGSSSIHLTIGNKSANKDGHTFLLNEAPLIIDDSTYVPLRFVSESLGTDVGWIKNPGTVTINSSIKQKFKVSHVRDGDTFEGIYIDG
ncbi:copper amine oxidase N-terminal domain-containing protein, partial [Klebsiella pneumoniae]